MTQGEYIAEVEKLKDFHCYIDNLKEVLGLEDNGRTGMYTELFNFFQNQVELLEKLVGDTNEYTSKYVYDTEFGKIRRTIPVGGRSLALKSAAAAYKAILAYAKTEQFEGTRPYYYEPTQSCVPDCELRHTGNNFGRLKHTGSNFTGGI